MTKYDIAFILEKVLVKPIAFHRIFATIGGGATEGLFLSQAYYWSFHTTLEGEWFYKTQEEWHEETALTRRELETAKRSLINKGILETKVEGLPRKTYYKVNRSIVYQLITEIAPNPHGCQFARNDKQECKKQQTSESEIANKQARNDKQECQEWQNNIYTENTTENTAEREETPAPKIDFSTQLNWETESVEVEVMETDREPFQPKSNKLALSSTNPDPRTNVPAAENDIILQKIQKYQDRYDSGLPVNKMELVEWAKYRLGGVVPLYRKSGVVLSSGENDINAEFALFVSKRNLKKGETVCYQHGRNTIKKWERFPEEWDLLIATVADWKASAEVGRDINLAAEYQESQKAKGRFYQIAEKGRQR